MLSVEDFPVRTSLSLASARDLKALARDYGTSSPAWLANFDPASYSWKTSQRSLVEEWAEFSATWPRSGMMRNGIASHLPTLAPDISATECGLLPTPAETDWKGQYRLETVLRRSSLTIGVRLPEQLSRLTLKVGRPNPRFWERMMMFPRGWTKLDHLETP